jgi:hypothetical protein
MSAVGMKWPSRPEVCAFEHSVNVADGVRAERLRVTRAWLQRRAGFDARYDWGDSEED